MVCQVGQQHEQPSLGKGVGSACLFAAFFPFGDIHVTGFEPIQWIEAGCIKPLDIGDVPGIDDLHVLSHRHAGGCSDLGVLSFRVDDYGGALVGQQVRDDLGGAFARTSGGNGQAMAVALGQRANVRCSVMGVLRRGNLLPFARTTLAHADSSPARNGISL